MPEVRDVQSTFTQGELDPLLRAQIAVSVYRNGADKLRNVVVLPQGGARRRPGTAYADTIPTEVTSLLHNLIGTFSAPNGGSTANLVDFDDSTDLQTTSNLSTTNPYVVFEVDYGGNLELAYFDVLNVSLTTGSISEEFRIQGKVDGGSYEDVGSAFRLIDTTERDYRRTPDKAYRYFRLVRIGATDGGSAKVNVGDCQASTQTSGFPVSESRSFGFIFSDDQRYKMLLTQFNLRVFRVTGGAETFQVDVPMPYDADELADVTYAIDKDTVVLFHPAIKTRVVQRQGDHDEWQQSAASFSNVPDFDFGAGNEDCWSDTRGWPRCGAFFQGRLIMAGSSQLPNRVIASKSGTLFDLDPGSATSTDAIVVDADPVGDEVPTFRHILIGAHVILMASSGEFYIPNSDDTAITPANTVLRRTASSVGMDSAALVPQFLEGAVYFVGRDGEAVRELRFSETEQNYISNAVSLLSSHLIRDPVGMCYRRQLSTEDTNWLLLANSDGTIACFVVLATQEIAAFSLWVTDGDFVDVANVKDDLYCVVERVIDGDTVRYLERFDLDLLLDAAVTGGAASSASNLDHLEGEAVGLLLDGAVQAPITVSSGAVTFARAASSSYEVGLTWPDVKAEEDAYQLTQDEVTNYADGESIVWVRVMPLPGAAQDGPFLSRRRRQPEILLHLHRTRECKVNGNRVPFRQMGGDLLDTAVRAFTGIKRVTGVLGWGREQVPEVTQTKHLSFTLLGVTTYNSTD